MPNIPRREGRSREEYMAEYRAACRDAVFNRYGKKCDCCGTDEQVFLTLCINNKEKRESKGLERGVHLYARLVNQGLPEIEGLRVLCFNCMHAERDFRGCPHKAE